MPPDTPPRRHRSRRLRKKLHLGEFRECGFALSFRFPDAMPEDERAAFWDAFIAMIEARGLAFGGGDAHGYVTKRGRGSATESDRLAVVQWLATSSVQTVAAGALEDAWYPPSSGS